MTVTLLRRTTDEQREALLLAQVSNRLAGIYDVSHSNVQYTNEEVWTAERMSDTARIQLGLHRTPKPGLVQITF